MKKSFPFCLLFITGTVLFASCDSHPDLQYRFSEDDTIRHEALTATGNVTWAGTPAAYPSEAPADEDPVIFNEQLALSFGPKTTMVYPELAHFGSLDTTDITPAIRTQLDAFLNTLSSGNPSDDYFDPDYQFSAVITRYQMTSRNLSFSSFTVGKPYIAHNEESPLYELPVLANGAENPCIIRLYLNPRSAEEGLFHIQQITFEEQLHD